MKPVNKKEIEGFLIEAVKPLLGKAEIRVDDFNLNSDGTIDVDFTAGYDWEEDSKIRLNSIALNLTIKK